MMYEPLKIERDMWERYAKFQPALEHRYALPNCTRTYLEYDGDGQFIERDPATGEIVDAGVIDAIFCAHEDREAA